MLCYRDMTFCKFNDCLDFPKCHRALTDQVREVAEADCLPICVFVDYPGCYVSPDDPATEQAA